jgi:hypothetical protein
MLSFNEQRLQREGRYHLAQRLNQAQKESEAAIPALLIAAGRAIARKNRPAFAQAAIEIAQHYANAGNATLAAHWRARFHAHKGA